MPTTRTSRNTAPTRATGPASRGAGVIISHDAALAFWSNPLLPAHLPPLDGRRARGLLASTRGTIHSPLLVQLAERPLFGHLPQRLDLLVSSELDHRRTAHAVFHVWKGPLPKGALCSLGQLAPAAPQDVRVAVSSPEFCFLQMAFLLDDLELAEVGFELCGTYALAPDAPHGMVGREPVTTPARIASFVEQAAGSPGIMRARRVAKRLLANSRSPKETQLALLACLPRRLGGAGLPAPELNARINPHGQAKHVLDRGWASPDLYWPSARLALEYDSSEFHTGAGPSERDARKRNAYALMDIDCLTITSGQMADCTTLFALYAEIAAHLGIRRPKPSAAILDARHAAHTFLMSGARRPRFTDPALIPNA